MNRHQRRAARVVAGFRDPCSKPDEYENRLHMIQHNEQALQLLLAKYIATGADPDVAVMIVDLRDELGRQLAEVVDSEHQAERIAGDNMIPTALIVISRLRLARGLQDSHPRTASALGSPMPQGRVHVVCIASGGITLVAVPIRSMPSAATA